MIHQPSDLALRLAAFNPKAMEFVQDHGYQRLSTWYFVMLFILPCVFGLRYLYILPH